MQKEFETSPKRQTTVVTTYEGERVETPEKPEGPDVTAQAIITSSWDRREKKEKPDKPKGECEVTFIFRPRLHSITLLYTVPLYPCNLGLRCHISCYLRSDVRNGL